MIQLEGLTKQDVEICDLLWNCDSLEAVSTMIAAMPQPCQQRAQVLQQLMIAAELDTYMEVTDSVKDYCSSL